MESDAHAPMTMTIVREQERDARAAKTWSFTAAATPACCDPSASEASDFARDPPLTALVFFCLVQVVVYSCIVSPFCKVRGWGVMTVCFGFKK